MTPEQLVREALEVMHFAYVKNGLGKHWQWVGVLFCVFAAIASFGIGNMSQVNSIVGSLNDAIDAFIPAAEGERKRLPCKLWQQTESPE